MSRNFDKNFSTLALAISLCLHVGFLFVGQTASAYSTAVPIKIDGSILLELVSLAAQAPVHTKNESSNDGKQKKMIAVKSRPLITESVSKNMGWNDREFKERQMRMDEKIETIRNQIKKLKEVKLNGADGDLKGFEFVSPELNSQSWRSYLSNLRKRVLDQWYPLILSQEDELEASEVRLDFYIDSNGRILSYEIAESNGSDAFKQICSDAFHKATYSARENSTTEINSAGGSLKVSLFFYYQ